MREANVRRLHTVGSHCMTFWNRQNYGNCKKTRSCQGLGGGRDEEAEQRVFRAVNLLRVIL